MIEESVLQANVVNICTKHGHVQAQAEQKELSRVAWKKHVHGDKTYTFGHLEPYTEVFIHPNGEKFTVDIRYTDHCFTRSPRSGEQYDPSLVWSDRVLGNGIRKIRLFCPTRNEMSRSLPDLVRAFPDKKPQHNKDKRNFFTIDTLTYKGDPVKYEIIFSVRKSGKARLELLVETAYINEPDYPAAPLDGRRVGFWIILGNTMHGKKIPS